MDTKELIKKSLMTFNFVFHYFYFFLANTIIIQIFEFYLSIKCYNITKGQGSTLLLTNRKDFLAMLE